MKKFPIFIIVPLLLLLASYFWWSTQSAPPTSSETEQSFIVPKGMSAAQIGSKLESEGFIKNAFAFKLYTQVIGKSKQIKAGQYTLTQNKSLNQVVNQLEKGPMGIWVTIPEGLRREEMITKIISTLSLTEEEDLFAREFLDQTTNSEGYLFPDTYLFPAKATATKVVSTLSSTFDKKTNEIKATNQSGLSFNQVIILASILERETIADEERPVVAGILIKRLNAGWPLQVDASVQYAIASSNCASTQLDCDWWPTLTRQDLDISSPYNSYKFTGLPPAPIANPGLSSLQAVSNYEDSPYWFYIHDPSGQIHYAKNLEEHNQNIRDYLGK